uniref:Uncharacterized protein n=1 Tax=Anguilla anguilla TaxID=7936 RepID=A0A0E9V979_ANGAN
MGICRYNHIKTA